MRLIDQLRRVRSSSQRLSSEVGPRASKSLADPSSRATRLQSLLGPAIKAKPSEIGALTGLRGLAAAWVLLLHLSEQTYPNDGPSGAVDHIARAGYLGVDLFFVLSGFVIAQNYQHFFRGWDAASYWRFLLTRLGRIYPVHLLVLLVTLAIVIVAASARRDSGTGGVDYSPQAFVANLLLVQAWGWRQLSWNGVAWTISAEWFAYLVFPFAARAIFARTSTLWARILVVLVAYGVTLSVLASTGFPTDTTELGLLRVMAGFSSGVVVWLVVRENSSLDKTSGLVVALGVVGLLVTIMLLPASDLASQALWPAPWFVLLVLGASINRGLISRLLSLKPAIFLGRISYSLYMVHVWVIFAVRTFIAPHLPGSVHDVAVLLLAPIVSIIIATVTFLTIEEPFRKRSKALARREDAWAPL